MTQETAKERTYREALEILRGMGINSKNRVMMPYGVAVTAQEFIEEKLEDAENMPSTTDKLSVEKLQEQLNTVKKNIEHAIGTIKHDGHSGTIQTDWISPDLEKALAEIGGDDE